MFFQQTFARLGRAFVLSTLPLTLIASVPTAAKAADLSAKFDKIYVFGDSLSDDGNAFKTTGLPPSPYYKGRFSNGPVWVEDLAVALGLNPDPTTNFAFGGANTGSDNTLIPGVQGLPGLKQQIDSFTATNPSADPNALYIVWGGANDYLSGHVTAPTVPVENLSAEVSSLVAVGAKNIMVVNLPDLGKLPSTRGTSQTSNSLNTLTSAHNSDLTSTLNSLRQNSGANLITLDVNSLFNRAIADPGEFGFTNVTDSCLSDSVACTANPNKFLFWDNIHPTAAGHELVADLAFSTLEPAAVPEPADGLGILALGALGAVEVYKRKQKKRCQTTTACSKLLKS